nr:probable nucleoredoxin 1 [Ipomoea batatas]
MGRAVLVTSCLCCLQWIEITSYEEEMANRVAIGGMPAAIAIGPCGLTLNTQVRQLIETHGSSAFPFTKEHVKKLQGQTTEKGRGGDEVHTEHDLALAHRNLSFNLDG